MANSVLLFHAEPTCETRGIGARLGECIVVYPDDRGNGGRGARQFLYVETDMPFEEAQAFWLRDGVPDDVKAAADAENTRFMKALRQYEIDVKAHDPKDFLTAPVKPVLDQKILDATKGWPQRMHRLDLSLIPAARKKAHKDFTDAIDHPSIRAQVAAAEASARRDKTAELDLSPSALKKLLNPDPAKKVAWEPSTADRKLDAIRDAEHVARRAVERPVLDAFPKPLPIFMAAAALRAAAVPNG